MLRRNRGFGVSAALLGSACAVAFVDRQAGTISDPVTTDLHLRKFIGAAGMPNGTIAVCHEWSHTVCHLAADLGVLSAASLLADEDDVCSGPFCHHSTPDGELALFASDDDWSRAAEMKLVFARLDETVTRTPHHLEGDLVDTVVGFEDDGSIHLCVQDVALPSGSDPAFVIRDISYSPDGTMDSETTYYSGEYQCGPAFPWTARISGGSAGPRTNRGHGSSATS